MLVKNRCERNWRLDLNQLNGSWKYLVDKSVTNGFCLLAWCLLPNFSATNEIFFYLVFCLNFKGNHTHTYICVDNAAHKDSTVITIYIKNTSIYDTHVYRNLSESLDLRSSHNDLIEFRPCLLIQSKSFLVKKYYFKQSNAVSFSAI